MSPPPGQRGRDSMANRLANETSPYLLQHKDNPVDWYPWGEEALKRAREEDKPVLLSVGYSACHWCHVMERESFEDDETARMMNEHFVNIKVDREERPDIDSIYMAAVQAITRHGGWPMTVFLTPDGAPFYGGTYYPPGPSHGMPSFQQILLSVRDAYENRREEVTRNADAIREYLRASTAALMPEAESAGTGLLDGAADSLLAQFDGRYGGFGGAPKFPQAMNLEVLLRHHARTGSRSALAAVELTCRRMAEGGIYDHLGGGFARYSVDQYWMIPHFEKVLYDNGQLLRLYANAALDADSEGHEGKFYVWNGDEVRALLPAPVYETFARRFGLDREPNFEGQWHLHAYRAEDDIATELGIDATEVHRRLAEAR